MDLTAHNSGMFFDAVLAEFYADHPLHRAERTFRGRHAGAFTARRMLDLGVGSGRTTQHFLPDVADYVGIDIAPEMLAVARRKHPGATLLDCDVRDIGRFGKGRFDFVLGAWGLLSAFQHDERLAILDAVHAGLSPGGTFFFSAHNRAWRLAGSRPLHGRSWHPREIVNSLHPSSWRNYFRLRRLRHEEKDYAFYNDGAHRWSGVFYYIDRDAQCRQLEAAGFELAEVYGEDGRVLVPAESTARDALLHYVAVKRPRSAEDAATSQSQQSASGSPASGRRRDTSSLRALLKASQATPNGTY